MVKDNSFLKKTKKRSMGPVILIIILTIVFIPAIVYAVMYITELRTKALPTEIPQKIEVTNVTVETWVAEGEEDQLSISVEYIGNTVCPHAMENHPDKRTHVQRALGKLIVKGSIVQMPSFESMVKVLRSSFPAETYSILKTEDEQSVIDCMHDNPMFVEDVCRSILAIALQEFSDLKLELTASAKSLESIHKHDVIAKGSARTDGQ